MNTHKNHLMTTTTIALLLCSFFIQINQVNAQVTKKFYSYRWKECQPNISRYFSMTTKTDSGYYRKDYYVKEKKLKMLGLYADSLCEVKNGFFISYYSNGIPQSWGKYRQDKKEGLWKSYYHNSYMADSTVYSDGKIVGQRLSWHENGYPLDSISLREDRSGVAVSWFDNGMPSAAGRFSRGMVQDGKWVYYHKNGKVSSIETYDKSKLINKQYFNEQGELMKDTTNNDRMAEFKGGKSAWQKYLSKKIYFPSPYEIINADSAIVVLTFAINEDGNIENVYNNSSFNYVFDQIAEKAIWKSPKWMPAIQHNRAVKQKYTLNINFSNYKKGKEKND